MAGQETSETDALNRSRELNATQCGEHRMLMRSISEIKESVKQINEKLSGGAINFATLELRLAHLERIVYGAVGLALISLAGAIISLVIRR